MQSSSKSTSVVTEGEGRRITIDESERLLQRMGTSYVEGGERDKYLDQAERMVDLITVENTMAGLDLYESSTTSSVVGHSAHSVMSTVSSREQERHGGVVEKGIQLLSGVFGSPTVSHSEESTRAGSAQNAASHSRQRSRAASRAASRATSMAASKGPSRARSRNFRRSGAAGSSFRSTKSVGMSKILIEDLDGDVEIGLPVARSEENLLGQEAENRLEEGVGSLGDLILVLDPRAKPPYADFRMYYYRPGEPLLWLQDKLNEFTAAKQATINATRNVFEGFLIVDLLIWFVVFFRVEDASATVSSSNVMYALLFYNICIDLLGGYVLLASDRFVLFHTFFIIGVLLSIFVFSQPLFALRCFAVLVSSHLRMLLVAGVEPSVNFGVPGDDLEFYQPQGLEYGIVVAPDGRRSAAAQMLRF